MVDVQDTLNVKELGTIKFSMSIDGDVQDPVGRASHIADGGDAGANATAIAAINVVLENLGFVATS